MRKTVRFLVVVAVCLVLLSVSFGAPHRVAQEGCPARPVGLEESNGPSACRPVAEEPVYHYPVDPRTQEELRRAYDGIAEAYSNRQTAVMRQIFSGVRDRIRSLRDDDFLYVDHCAYSAYLDALFVQRGKGRDFRPADDFSDVALFKQYAEALLELVRITADGCVARGEHDLYRGIEALPLRLYARWVFPCNLKIHEHGSREDAVKITRLAASAELETFAGYIPKWLEEIK